MFRKSLIASLFIAMPALAAGCFTAPSEGPVEGDTTEERGPIGKADLYGSCMEIDIKYCGGKSSGNCYCDELCESFDDCCADYQEECTDDPAPTCDPTLICGQAITCHADGQWYPTTCGPANCDAPMGPCDEPDPEPEYCGGFGGFQCENPDDFCNYGDSEGCGFADGMGVCEPKPEVCAEIYMPVCGCDGNDYGNPCEANGNGTSVQFVGDCACGEGKTQQYCWGQMQCVPIGAQC